MPIILNAFVNAEVGGIGAFRANASFRGASYKKVSGTEWIMGNAIMEKRAHRHRWLSKCGRICMSGQGMFWFVLFVDTILYRRRKKKRTLLLKKEKRIMQISLYFFLLIFFYFYSLCFYFYSIDRYFYSIGLLCWILSFLFIFCVLVIFIFLKKACLKILINAFISLSLSLSLFLSLTHSLTHSYIYIVEEISKSVKRNRSSHLTTGNRD